MFEGSGQGVNHSCEGKQGVQREASLDGDQIQRGTGFVGRQEENTPSASEQFERGESYCTEM